MSRFWVPPNVTASNGLPWAYQVFLVASILNSPPKKNIENSVSSLLGIVFGVGKHWFSFCTWFWVRNILDLHFWIPCCILCVALSAPMNYCMSLQCSCFFSCFFVVCSYFFSCFFWCFFCGLLVLSFTLFFFSRVCFVWFARAFVGCQNFFEQLIYWVFIVSVLKIVR